MATLWDNGATWWDDGGTFWDGALELSAAGCYALAPRCGIDEYEFYPCEEVVCRAPSPPLNPVRCAVPCLMVPCQMVPCETECSEQSGQVGSAVPGLFIPCLATPCSPGGS